MEPSPRKPVPGKRTPLQDRWAGSVSQDASTGIVETGKWKLDIVQQTAFVTDPTGATFDLGSPIEMLKEDQVGFAGSDLCELKVEGAYLFELKGTATLDFIQPSTENECQRRRVVLTGVTSKRVKR